MSHALSRSILLFFCCLICLMGSLTAWAQWEPSGQSGGEGILSDQSRQALLQTDSVNLLSNVDFAAALKEMRSFIDNAPRETWTVSDEEPIFQRGNRGLSYIRDRLPTLGSVVYNPFGGVDVSTFQLSSNIEDVFSHGAEPFGKREGIFNIFKTRNHTYIKNMLTSFSSFDQGGIYHDLTSDFEGIGQRAVFRIQNDLDADILGITFYDLTDDGQIRFLKLAEVTAEQWHDNALIVFKDRKSGQVRRFWYTRQNVSDVHPSFLRFTERLKFNTLLLKAVPGHFNDEKTKKASMQISTDAAIRNQALVITDTSPKGVGYVSGREVSEPYPVLKNKDSLQTIVLPPGHAYGYSSSTGRNRFNVVYVGRAQDLIGTNAVLKTTVMTRFKNLIRSCILRGFAGVAAK